MRSTKSSGRGLVWVSLGFLIVLNLACFFVPQPISARELIKESNASSEVSLVGPGNGNTSVAKIGDMDGDGDLDIVLSKSHLIVQSHVPGGVYLNDGEANFASYPDHALPLPPAEVKDLELGDIDGDNDLDIIVKQTDSPIRIIINNGKGELSIGLSIGPTATDTTSIAVGDIDGDGDLDIITGSESNANRIYLNLDNGTSFASTSYGNSDNDTNDVALVDIDKDGHVDIVNANAYVSLVYFNLTSNSNGAVFYTGSFTCSFGVVWCFAPYENSKSVDVGDVNGDDLTDVVVGLLGKSEVYFGTGFRALSEGQATGYSSGSIKSLDLGDVDNDGDLDLLIGSLDLPAITCINNNEGGFAKCTTINRGPSDMLTMSYTFRLPRKGAVWGQAGSPNTR